MVHEGATRRSISLGAAVLTVTVVTALALSGCSAGTSSTASHSPSPSASKSASHPTPTPTPTFAEMQYTCNSILPPATLAVFKSKANAGFTLQTDYMDRMQNIGSNLVMFNTYGGILCQWAYPSGENSVDYAFSPITASDATTQESTLTSEGYAGAPQYHGTLFTNSDSTDYPDEYLFIKGYWFQASSDSVMQLLVDNVFVTQ